MAASSANVAGGNINNMDVQASDSEGQADSFSLIRDLENNNHALKENNKALFNDNNLLRSHIAVMTRRLDELQHELESLRKSVSSTNDSSMEAPRKIPRTMPEENADTSISNNNNSSNSNINIHNNITNHNNNNLLSNAAKSTNQPNYKPIKNKKKIIQCINVNANTLNQHLKEKKCINYTIKQNNIKAPVKINITDEKEVAEIKTHLTNAQVSFHEYKWDDEKHKAFIIKGLVSATPDDIPSIREQLLQAGLPDEIKVSLFTTGYMRSNPRSIHNSLIQLITPPKTDIKLINSIKYIDHISVKIEPQLNNKVIQCKNCQRFGHSAGGCQHVHRCVKCGGDHYKDTCPRSFNKTTVPLVCCNCNGSHTANNLRECPVAQQYLLSISSGLNNNNNTIHNSNKNSVSSGFPSLESLNSARKNNSSNNNNPKNVRFSNMNSNNNFKVQTNSPSYAQVMSARSDGSLNDISKKLDFLINSVLKHEQILNSMLHNE